MSGIDNYREVRPDIDGFKTLQDSAGKVLYLRKSKHIHQSCEQIVIPTWNCKYLFLNGEIVAYAYRVKTVCGDMTSKLARDLFDDTWIEEHTIVTENGKACILIEYPGADLKALWCTFISRPRSPETRRTCHFPGSRSTCRC